jgi:uncharacterized protein YgiM (DUF1202 family)
MDRNYKNYNKIGHERKSEYEEQKETVIIPLVPEKSFSYPTLKKVVDCNRLNVRKSPSLSGEILTIIKVGTELMADDSENGWSYVYLENGTSGYVMEKYIR